MFRGAGVPPAAGRRHITGMTTRAPSRLASLGFALRGLAALYRSEPNARLHLAATVAAVGLGAVLRLSRLEWCAVAGAVALVWVAEAFNTAVETVCDLVQPAPHPLVARAKDVAAAGVLAAAIGAAVIGVLVFGGRLWG